MRYDKRFGILDDAKDALSSRYGILRDLISNFIRKLIPRSRSLTPRIGGTQPQRLPVERDALQPD
jgi:hypothetical protein